MATSPESVAAATAIVRSLTGGRWTWPPVEVRELYPAPTGRVLLRGRPVISVVSVKHHDSQEDLEYELFRGGRLKLVNPITRIGREQPRVDVTYRFGSEPPRLATNAIDILASEMDLSLTNPAQCRIPERVQSINRQGVSWTLIDPQEFMDKGRVGIYEVDLAIRTLGASRKRARVFSPEHPPPERLSVDVILDGGTTSGSTATTIDGGTP